MHVNDACNVAGPTAAWKIVVTSVEPGRLGSSSGWLVCMTVDDGTPVNGPSVACPSDVRSATESAWNCAADDSVGNRLTMTMAMALRSVGNVRRSVDVRLASLSW